MTIHKKAVTTGTRKDGCWRRQEHVDQEEREQGHVEQVAFLTTEIIYSQC